MASRHPEFKVALCGDGGVGKTSFLARHLTGDLRMRRYRPRVEADVEALAFHTNCGRVSFNVFDTANLDSANTVGVWRQLSWVDSDCAIVMFDVASRITYKHLLYWHRNIVRLCGHIPIVLVGNKVDLRDREVMAKHIQFHRKHNLQYYDMSVLTSYNVEKPFLWLARRLVNQDNLQFVGPCARAPPDFHIDAALVEQHERELQGARKITIGGSDDDL
mmetsp:Transcript_1210/g.3541  ORF Transcript_1210/g.3541 Transcript_1210/m.3541 type:complete len:218 (-) Transcript_1210:82-735(-)|eukprot:CAMPEP_0198491412 /NCGR_PEP_ID=MMETSP1462-20131121/2766_1 /TAXON_ID=1333877 /ORGANISM="Brandtodinium nutriculum, Strain RCC3387" /LENGTH=217 /DNA_ID=CAMNT_0044220019 /DNA_START=121 /DNA_END=774 /DNA_ORIENTATION=-